MAEVIVENAAVVFGIDTEEGSGIITHKVSATRRIKKKDLRGKKGGYKAIVSFGAETEISIEGVATAGGTGGYSLGAEAVLANDDFSAGGTMRVEELTITEKNDDWKRLSVKIVGSDSLTGI